MFETLRDRGFQIEFESHAEAILSVDFKQASAELETALLRATIPIEEIIAGGGGEAKGTQRLRKALTDLGWPKMVFEIERWVNGKKRESQSHIVDHVREFPRVEGEIDFTQRVALEIEWNNKDAFYDRDLDNFKRLHADGAISVGVMVTRGRSLHARMPDLVRRFLDERQIQGFERMAEWGYEPTSRQRREIMKRINRAKNPLSFREAFTSQFVKDKFGEATTHWNKLEKRLNQGVGNPCPMVLIGLPDSIVTFHEGRAALEEVQAADEAADDAAGDDSV